MGSESRLRINDSGQVVGVVHDANPVEHGFLYSAGTFTTIAPTGALSSEAIGINNSGQIAGTYQPGGSTGTHGFIDTGGIFATLDPPGSSYTVASGINSAGQVVGIYDDSSGNPHGFVATPTSQTTPLPTGILPAPDVINVPIGALPPADHLLTRIQPFLNQYGSELPQQTQNYFNSAVSQTTPFLTGQSDLKSEAAVVAPALQLLADGLDLVNPTTKALDLVTFGLSSVGSAVGLGFKLPDAATTAPTTSGWLASFSLATADAALTGASCLAAGGITCAFSIVSFALSDLVVPELTRFANSDPFDSDFATVFKLPMEFTAPAISTGDSAVDLAATDAVSKLETAAAYLFAVNVSIDRYGSALSAGDTSSAILQMEAILHYLGQSRSKKLRFTVNRLAWSSDGA